MQIRDVFDFSKLKLLPQFPVCLDLVSFSVLIQIKPQVSLLVVPFLQLAWLGKD